jgi:hypothetical protein
MYTVESLKAEVLGDLVDEDYEGVWEPLWRLRNDDRPEPERQRIAEQVLRDLFAEGLIYFFRVPPPYTGMNDAAENESARLTPERVEELLRASWWRGREGIGDLPDDEPTIWMGSTPKAAALG